MNASNLSKREWLKLTGGAGLAGLSLASGGRATSLGGQLPQVPVGNSLYSKHVVSLKAVGYGRLDEINTPTAIDWCGHEHTAVYHCWREPDFEGDCCAAA